MSASFPNQDSNFNYAPVTLYQWTRGSIVYAYCSADQDIVYRHPGATVDTTYVALPMIDDGFRQSGESSDDNVKVQLPWTTDIVQLFNGTSPSDEIFLRVFRMSYGDDIAPLAWTGSIVEVNRLDQATAEINHQTLAQSFERNGLTLSYTRNCPFFLYDPSTCKVNPLLFQTVAQLTAVGGQTITADAFANFGDQYFAGGYVEWAVGGTSDTFERRPVQQQIGNQILLAGTTDGIVVNQSVNVYPGCDRAVTTCKTKFDNLPNCGACPFLPGINPFDDVNIF